MNYTDCFELNWQQPASKQIDITSTSIDKAPNFLLKAKETFEEFKSTMETQYSYAVGNATSFADELDKYKLGWLNEHIPKFKSRTCVKPVIELDDYSRV